MNTMNVFTEVADDKCIDMTTEYLKDDIVEMENNKKEFVNEVVNGIPRKKSLCDFLNDNTSYNQFRDDIEECLLFLEYDKIHKAMKCLDWRWVYWEDKDGEEYQWEVPSVYAIKYFVKNLIEDMKKWIYSHPKAEEYFAGTGGFEVHMYMVHDNESPDDYDNQVRLVIRFVLEQYDNGR